MNIQLYIRKDTFDHADIIKKKNILDFFFSGSCLLIRRLQNSFYIAGRFAAFDIFALFPLA